MEETHEAVETVSKEATDLLLDSEIVDIFPRLDKIPKAIATTFVDMIHCYLQAVKKTPELPQVTGFRRVRKVFDDQGKLVCLFKSTKDSKKEAAVYLLDHPLLSHRSTSSDLVGFGGAPPTVFIQTKDTSGCLISYVENDGVVGNYTGFKFKTLPQEVNKLCIFHIRFGNADCHDRNTLSKIDEEGIHRLTPIDHEECFIPDYSFRRVWWAETKYADDPFTQEMVNYVEGLDVDRDVGFLKTCGWDVPSEITTIFKIFTLFLKKAVKLQLTASEMAPLVQSSPRTRGFNLCDMAVGDKAHERIEARLTEYARPLLRKKRK